MKKLVAVTTVILVILLAVLGIIIVKENVIGDGEKRTTLSELKGSLSSNNADGQNGEGDDAVDWEYDGALLRMKKQVQIVNYQGRGFEVEFTNPFYEEGSDKYINIVFYDREHGYLLKSLGAGTDSEFFEAYKTEDGCQTWNKCKVDVWFDLDGENHLDMISEHELIYVHTNENETLGISETTISYSSDGGDSWYAFEGSTVGANSEEILAAIEGMSLEEKVAQLFMVSPETLTGVDAVYYTGDVTYEALDKYPVCGLIYSRKNIDYKEQFEGMIEKADEYGRELTGYPLFLAVAEEGGTDTVLYGNADLEDYDSYDYYDDDYGYDDDDDGSAKEDPVIPSMAEIGRKGNSQAAYQAGQAMGELLDEYGLNMNLAPVADVLSGNSYQMGSRSFGTDAQAVSDMAGEVMRGMKEKDIYSVMKYFPGYGAAAASMSGYPIINSSLDELMNKELLPYIDAIQQGVDFIMVGHIVVPEITGNQMPSSLSDRMIGEVLREKLGFKGVVMTDYLNDQEIQKNYDSGEAAVKAIQAGADILVEPADFTAAYEGVLSAVEKGRISEERIDESLYRILKLKMSRK